MHHQQSNQSILTIPSIQKAPLNTSTRLFSTTLASRFTLTTQKSSSPFRLSSDKHAHELERSPHDDAYYSPYKPKRQWPPDMSKLSPKHQFRLERKYRRRAALKYARPKFIKTVTLVQWGVIGCEYSFNRYPILHSGYSGNQDSLLMALVYSCCDLRGAVYELGYPGYTFRWGEF